jgi:hypothetical protein
MPWSDININLNYVKGDARGDITDPRANPGVLEIEPYREASAKAMFVTACTRNRKLGPLIIARGGRETFFDEVATAAVEGGDLELEVGTPLAFAYLHLFYHGSRPTATGRFHDDAIYYKVRFEEAVDAFCVLAPGVIQAVDDPDVTLLTSGTISTDSPMSYE